MSEPAVCVPNASGTMKSATAAAEPLEEPPRGGGAARGAAGRARRIEWMTRLPRHEGGELRRDRLAEDRAAGTPGESHHGGVAARPVAGIDWRAVGARHVVRVEDVLHADRHAAQRRRRIVRRGKVTRKVGPGFDRRLPRAPRDLRGAGGGGHAWTA